MRAGRRPLHPLVVAEPAPRERPDPPLVVDCSVLAAALFAETQADTARRHLIGRTLHAPALIDVEMASVALRKTQALPTDTVLACLASYRALALVRHPVESLALVGLAQRYRLTVYDAAYLHVASVLRAPLITFDQALGRAARQHLAGLS